MADPLKICFVSAEVTPFAKTGGLGDVAAALPRTLHRLGHDVRLFLPFYARIDRDRHLIQPVDFLRDIPLELGGRRYRFSVYTTEMPRSSLPLYLIYCPALFDRPKIYGGGEEEAIRFALLTRAAIECCQRMGFGPDVFHANDWHTALLPLYLRTRYQWDELFARSKTALTIHNIGYQGVFPAEMLGALGFAEHVASFDHQDLGRGILNFLKTGILYADVVTTVSPTHATEIRTPDYGMGLDGPLRQRSGSVVGILNGIDPEEWSPETDPLIPVNYSADDLEGKAFCKLALMRDLGLDHEPTVPALGIVTRLVKQKGIDLLRQVLPSFIADVDCRLAALGSGETEYEEFFAALQRRFPGRVCFYRGYSNELAHRIEAGCDLFLMPSLYEPCGLNQMYSLAYGTPPIVRKTGGLADAVKLYQRGTGEGNGLVFDHASAEALSWALGYALEIWRDRPAWDRMVQNGMRQDFSWETQAGQYVELYRRLGAI
jgi:starch synthase